MFPLEFKKADCRHFQEHLMVSNIDHTSNTVQEKSADGGKQKPRTNVN